MCGEKWTGGLTQPTLNPHKRLDRRFPRPGEGSADRFHYPRTPVRPDKRVVPAMDFYASPFAKKPVRSASAGPGNYLGHDDWWKDSSGDMAMPGPSDYIGHQHHAAIAKSNPAWGFGTASRFNRRSATTR